MASSNQVFLRLGVIPVVAFASFFALVSISNFDAGGTFKSPPLLLALNAVFLTGTGLVVSIISAKSYLAEGSISLLLLGMATATGGLAASVAGLGAHISVNQEVTIFNLGFLFAGGLQVLSAVTTLVGALPSPSSTRRLSLITGYVVVVGFVTALSVLALSGLTPASFAASGPTLTRQWNLGIDILLFASSSVFFCIQYLQGKSQVLFWYSMALALLALSLFGAAIYTTANGLVNWAARVSLYLGGFYFLAAVLVGRSEAKSGWASFSVKWAEAFKNDPKQLDVLFSKMSDGIAFHKIVCNAGGEPIDYVFLDVNQAFEQMTGLSREKIMGKTATQVMRGAEDDLVDRVNAYGHVALTGESARFESYSKRLKKWYYVSAYSPKKDYFVELVEDITERKELEEKLEAYTKNLEALVDQRTKALKDSERMAAIGATASMVGHDIRNPLQAITGDLYLLKQEIDDSVDDAKKREMQESVDSIEENVTYINKIVSDLQDYTRPIKPKIEEVNPKDIVNTTMKALNIASNIETEVDVTEGWTLRTDGAYLRRVLTNLINNAAQAMPNGGKLTVAAHARKSHAIITIKDTGVGVPKEIKEKLFEPLFTTKPKGQGLGLAVVKRLVEGLNGKVSFESEEGKGTKFTITLPLGNPEPSPA